MRGVFRSLSKKVIALHGHRHDADTHIIRHSFEQRAPEPVGRTEVSISAAEWRHGLAPCAQLAVSTIGSSHTQKTFTYCHVLLFNGSLTCHIRLSEAEKDPEIRVWRLYLDCLKLPAVIAVIDHLTGHASVDADVFTSDEARLVGTKEQHHIGNIQGVTDTTCWLLYGIGAFIDSVVSVYPTR